MRTTSPIAVCTMAILLLGNSNSPALGTNRPVSTSGHTNAAGAGGSYTPIFSGDGRFVAFVSQAKNLVTNNDRGLALNVFVRDLAQNKTVLVSVSTNGLTGANLDANFMSISSNGQFVAFASAANNLVNNDTNDAPDIFVRDLGAGATTLVSVDVTGTSSAAVLSATTRYRLSRNPQISSDGRWVIYESLATNLVSLDDNNEATDVFARDLQMNSTFLVSVNAAGNGSGNGTSESPSMTPDGRLVVFVSTADDLVSGATNHFGDIYIRDLGSSQTVWASVNIRSHFAGNRYRCFNPVISANGRFVAFKATSLDNPDPVRVFRHDLQTAVTIVVNNSSWPVSWPQISADGRFVASESSNDVYRWDGDNGSNVLVSVSLAGQSGSSQPSHSPVMSPDGEKILFLSAGTNLTANSANGLSQLFLRDMVLGTTRLMSVNRDGASSSKDVDVIVPAIRSDGQMVAFESLAPDLVENDLNQASDVFLRDLNSEITTLVSARDLALPESTGAGLSTLMPKGASADGQTIGFWSSDSNLTPEDGDGFVDVFAQDLRYNSILRLQTAKGGSFSGYPFSVEATMSADGRYLAVGTLLANIFLTFTGTENLIRCDLEHGTNELVSVSFGGPGPPNANSYSPAISSDGSLVAFQSAATDIVPDAFRGFTNIFIRNIPSHSNILVSINLAGTYGGNGNSVNPIFSPDNRWLLFSSAASDLATNAPGGIPNLLARDLDSNTTRVVSVAPDGRTPLGYARGAIFSADSRHVAFVTSNNQVYVYDFGARTSLLVCANCENPSLNSDGHLVVYEALPGGASARNIAFKDLRTGASALISSNYSGSGGGNGDSSSPLLSWDGRYIVYASKASDLVQNDTNKASDIFIRDLARGTTMFASLNLQGTGPGNGVSSKPLMAADGRTIVFQSFASDLVPGDYNEHRDVFVLRLGGPDSDGDGMDDDWEIAYFGTLSRDGSGDFDGDGKTDLQEFLSGTDPTDLGSVLQVVTLSLGGGGATRIIWSAAPGRSYRVQARDSLEGPGWRDISGRLVANGTTGSFLDGESSTSGRRFYRVLVEP